jgi:hypothetical protein
VVTEAEVEARELRHNHVGVEHFLLGLLRQRDSAAAQVLRSRGVSLDGLRVRVLEIVGVGEDDLPPDVPVPFTPRAKKVLELALREALALGTNSVGPEHLLLGIARENESVAMRILAECGLPAEVIRGAMVESMPAPQPALIPSDRDVPVPGIVPRQRSMGVRVNPSPPVRRLLMAAGALALDDGRTEIDIDDVWVALTREPTAVQLAADLGLDEPAVRAAIARRGAAVEPPEASASG